MNQDGKSATLTAPNGPSQEEARARPSGADRLDRAESSARLVTCPALSLPLPLSSPPSLFLLLLVFS